MRRASGLTYVDTSVWCAYCFNEQERPAAVTWLEQTELDHAATAAWTRTEFASACGIKLRAKGQTRGAVNKASREFDAVLEMTQCLDVVEDDFLHAAKLCRDSVDGLRASDALHLAVALRHGCATLASLDAVMNTNARQLGLKVVAFA